MTSRPRRHRHVIVVGQTVKGLLQRTLTWLHHHHWTVEQCRHIYAVAALLGQAQDKQVLVVGQPKAFVQQRGELIPLLVNTGVLACGLICREDRTDWTSMEILQTNGLPVFMCLEAFSTWLTAKVDIDRASFSDEGMDAWEKAYRINEAELLALLGEDHINKGSINAADDAGRSNFDDR